MVRFPVGPTENRRNFCDAVRCNVAPYAHSVIFEVIIGVAVGPRKLSASSTIAVS